MPTATDYTTTAQEQALKTVKQGQQVIVEAIRAWANTVEKAIPETPVIPYSDELPKPQEIIKSSFAFAEQLLKSQKEFAESVLDAASPVLGKPATTTKA
jgi:hypothetical protein